MVEKVLGNDYLNWKEIKDPVKKTEVFVEKLFAPITDKSGKPYVDHLKRVASHFQDETYRIIALLHDTLEDTDMMMDDLREMGYSQDILDVLEILTRKKESYEEYIHRIVASRNSVALAIKIRDMEDNMDENRLCHVEENEAKRLRKKYQRYYPILKENVKENKNYVRY